MRIRPSRLAVFSAIALAGQSLAGAALADDWSLRPSMVQTSYIHVVPVESFSDKFAALIRNGVQQSGTVQAAAARWHAEEFGVDAAAGAQSPSAVVFGEAGVASGPVSSPYAYGVRISVPVYDGFSAGYATEAQASLASAAQLAAMDELAATLVDLVAAAAAIRLAEDTYKARQAQYSSMRALLAVISSERETGTASKVDTDQVEAQLSQIDIELKAAAVARIEANESFARIAGNAPSYVGVIGSIERFLPRSQNQAVDIALAENPLLGQRQHLADAAQSSRNSVAAGFGPDLDFDVSLGGSGDWWGHSASALDARAVFRLEIPLTVGTDAAVHKKALEAQASEIELGVALTGVTVGVSAAYERLKLSRSGLSLAYDAVIRSRTVLSGMEMERDLGDRSVSDLMAAESAVAEAQVRLADQQYKVTISEHLLAAQIGRIDEIYGVALN
jgi:outer membrane protein